MSVQTRSQFSVPIPESCQG